MFSVSEEEAAAIRAVYEQRGELSAAVELRRRFPGILDNAQARKCARIIAGWKPLLNCDRFGGRKRPPAPDALRRITPSSPTLSARLDGPSEGPPLWRPRHGKPGIARQCILRLHASRSLRSLVQNPLRGLRAILCLLGRWRRQAALPGERGCRSLRSQDGDQTPKRWRGSSGRDGDRAG